MFAAEREAYKRKVIKPKTLKVLWTVVPNRNKFNFENFDQIEIEIPLDFISLKKKLTDLLAESSQAEQDCKDFKIWIVSKDWNKVIGSNQAVNYAEINDDKFNIEGLVLNDQNIHMVESKNKALLIELKKVQNQVNSTVINSSSTLVLQQ